DPELDLDVVVLGLVYGVDITDGHVHVTMSLTTPMCPAAPQIVEQARAAVEALEGVESAEVELTFEPRWTPDRIDPIIRSALGLGGVGERGGRAVVRAARDAGSDRPDHPCGPGAVREGPGGGGRRRRTPVRR